jgi:hypothetical protein
MNRKIRELAEQANLYARSDNSSMLFENYQKRYTEKFAELIVQECADIIQRESDKAIRNNTYMGDDVPASVTQWAIKKHFGVE